MEYEVFLMTPVRERWISHEAYAAIVPMHATTARVITSAALIMVSIFCAFVPPDAHLVAFPPHAGGKATQRGDLAPSVCSGNPTSKQFALGMAAAVAIDASGVRCLLVPALMSLLGRAGGWTPTGSTPPRRSSRSRVASSSPPGMERATGMARRGRPRGPDRA